MKSIAQRTSTHRNHLKTRFVVREREREREKRMGVGKAASYAAVLLLAASTISTVWLAEFGTTCPPSNSIPIQKG
jgi:hypothetical protein